MKKNYYRFAFIVMMLVFLSPLPMLAQHGIVHDPSDYEHLDNCGVHYDAQKFNRVAKANAVTVKFTWPMRQAAGYNDPGYWSISNYVDEDRDAGVLDYNGGTQTYDGHWGTDFSLFPYGWKKVQDDQVEVIAAAPGIIEYKVDGNEHDHCDWNQPEGWNAVYVRHDDGTLALYGHMKNGSTTSKNVGDAVARGEYLGVVASSGISTGPHLHFEIHDNAGNLLDPWFGPSNSTGITESMWLNQEPYLPSGINYLAISFDVTQPWSPSCPTVETTNERSAYLPGETIYFTTLFRHQKTGTTSTHRILRPDNSVFQTWTTTSPDTYTESWWWRSFVVPGALGTWTFEVSYLGNTYTKNFTVTNAAVDCFGEPGGSAYIDECGACVGGSTGVATTDTDGDGTADCNDLCDLDPNKVDPETCGCGVPEGNCEPQCLNVPAFDPNQVYAAPGNQVTYDGKLYENKWWTQFTPPSSDPWGPWAFIDFCSATPMNCTGVPQWNSTTAYTGGAHVVYNGKQYTNAWWSYGETPGTTEAWQLNGSCASGTFAKVANTEAQITVSPNPADKDITLNFENISGNVEVVIYDAVGRIIKTYTTNSSELNLSLEDCPSGFLFVKVTGEDFSRVVKVKKR